MDITLEQIYQSLVATDNVYFHKPAPDDAKWNRTGLVGARAGDTDPLILSISETWSIGGEHGGSCWGGEPYAYIADNIPNTTDKVTEWLDPLLEEFIPNITLLQYRKVTRELTALTTHLNYSVGEYYGNYTNYRGYAVKLSDIHQVLANLEV